ncbi:hypothetical protein [Spirosoma endbachense]|uniref:Uncharacterized protein n=1 Tax=Spirosoma endbachense TaxID=2666025 RepID=A0A6P1W1C8_9BACT|nr:hypothetical protein [Spirosoma endbachense]QHV99241.1 hypothetical protein GJR95_31380 [Spirosoma endbachense]
MKVLTIVILFLAMNASVIFLAGLHKVPKLVRLSVAGIAASFGLTLLLVWKWSIHSNYGIVALGLSITLAAATGFRHTHKAVMTRDERVKLIREYAIGVVITSVAAVLATALILQLNEPVAATPVDATQAPTSTTVAIGDSTQKAIDQFNALSK